MLSSLNRDTVLATGSAVSQQPPVSGGGNITTLHGEYQSGWVSTMFVCIIRCPFEYGSTTGGQFAARPSEQETYIKTHGCQMNEYDSSRIRDLLRESHDLIPTDNPEEADVLLLNTCSIREKAQEKVFHQLGRWKRLKKNPTS